MIAGVRNWAIEEQHVSGELEWQAKQSFQPTRPEILRVLNSLLDAIHEQISHRRQWLCIVIPDVPESTSHDPDYGDLASMTMALHDVRASIVVESSFEPLFEGPARQSWPVIQVPPLPIRSAEDEPDVVRPEVETVVRELLASSVDVNRLFADPECVIELARLSGGCLGQLIQLARDGIEQADAEGHDTIRLAHVHHAADRMAGFFAMLAGKDQRDRLLEIARERQLHANDVALVGRSLVFVYDGGAWADVNPLLRRTPWFVQASRATVDGPPGSSGRSRDLPP